jgi:Kef-type K+ transport system membrane component KefB/mannitol/fructose-specific phosphotransferase system IIA component (Ntr-type)
MVNWLKKVVKISGWAAFFVLLFHIKAHAYESGGESIIEKTSLLVMQIGCIIFAAHIGGSLFERWNFPSVLGEILAGVIIGPYFLGQMPFWGFAHGLFPIDGVFPVSVELYSIATIASIILLFFVGLETDITTFLKFSFTGSIVGILGVIFSFIAGDLLGVLLSQPMLGRSCGVLHPIPLFLGVISTATSVGITARILSEKRKLNSPEGFTILAAAVVDDVLGIIILAIVLGMSKSGEIGWVRVSMIALKAIAIWVGFTLLGLKYAHKLTERLKAVKDRTFIAILSLGVALLLAGIFEKSGLAMIIGSYVAGLSLSKTDISFIIQEKLESLQKFFVPIFFCVMGMLINLKELASPHVLLFGFLYTLIAVVGKLVGCSFPALFLNFNWRGALRVGVGMVPRGEVALIIAGVGLATGIINDEIFNVTMIMTFATTLITPMVLDKMLESDKPVLRKEQELEEENVHIDFAMPSPETAELLLSKVIGAFENEGFFVNRMTGERKLYQIRKQNISIVLRYSTESLVFDCLAQYAAFVHTLFYEVIAELEYTMRSLQTLTDKNLIGKRIFDAAESAENGNGADSNKKFQIISSLAINVELKGTTKEAILKELVDLLIASKQLNPKFKEQAYKDLIEREEIMSTGMQDGIALPHAKTTAVNGVVTVVGLSKQGVDFSSLDKKPSKIFILTLASKDNPHAYLQSMSEISQFLGKEENRQKVLQCQTSSQLFTLFNTEV